MSDPKHDNKPLFPVDPKELAPAGVGLFIGLLILLAFLGIALALGLPTVVESWDIPKQ